jgi:hypothetical protein
MNRLLIEERYSFRPPSLTRATPITYDIGTKFSGKSSLL